MSSPITSRQNKTIKLLRAVLGDRKARRREGLFAVEGTCGLTDALAAGWRIECALLREPARDEAAQAALVESLTTARVPQLRVEGGVLDAAVDVVASVDAAGLLALPDAAAPAPWEGNLGALVLEEVRDPGNLGTILRTAHASALTGVMLVGSCVDVYSPKVVRSAAGSLFRVPVRTAPDAQQAREAVAGATHLAAVAGDGAPWDAVDVTGPVAIWLGSESHGLSDAALSVCDAKLHIPISPTAESLNVSAAAAVLAFELVRQRRRVPERQ